ncbi:hypothetical protein A3C25_04510 [Candidatus Roizmanbacteria bacterium RIFCSPHIGHO2_02_FULL_38_11]|uniref:Beta-glucosidase n=1 Tax=Candidatus Roizmanbacteria bacterium RIFCSPHIGHO2_02_FULL_38_11 TaxID=1802039 RepID=A0A1F7GXQ9_9BACT|nr:MAG: hypothetical protein A3C25_04510 [Candidatus Roizmanbacteria bacterium RIFCSPHIGHO2_02_FULL_38_11]
MGIESGSNILKFPAGFKWGSAVSAYQVEGNRDGSRDTDWDRHVKAHPEIIRAGEVGPDWWTVGRAEDDLGLIADLGLNTFRLSIEQDRIILEPGVVDQEAIFRYRQILKRLKSLNIEPVITLNHFTLPAYLAEAGGWANPETKQAFVDFVRTVVQEFSDVKYWLTLNEPNNLIAMGYIFGKWPPNIKKSWLSLLLPHNLVRSVARNLIEAHEEAAETIWKNIPDAKVGVANNIQWLKPKNPRSPFDLFLVRFANWYFNFRFIEATNATTDFLGINFYTGYNLKFRPALNWKQDDNGSVASAPLCSPSHQALFTSDTGWPIVPDFFSAALLELYQRFNKPIFVSENGLADRDDELRSFYILTHLAALHEAIQRGVDVWGYLHWAAVDNQEWTDGYKYRYGLIAVDPRTGERTVRNSARMYAEIAGANEIDVNRLADRYLTDEEQQVTALAIIENLQKAR